MGKGAKAVHTTGKMIGKPEDFVLWRDNLAAGLVHKPAMGRPAQAVACETVTGAAVHAVVTLVSGS